MARKTKIEIKPLDKQSVEIIELLVDLTNGNFFKDPEKPTMSEKISLIAQYTGEKFGDISAWTYNTIHDVFGKIVGLMNQYEPKEPPRSIVVDGVQYDLVIEPREQTAGWWHHLEQINVHTSPIDFLGLAYVEHGQTYAMMDERKNIVNPTNVRGARIAEEFNAAMFLDLMGFFLVKFEGALKLSLILKDPETMMMLRRMKKPETAHSNGKR